MPKRSQVYMDIEAMFTNNSQKERNGSRFMNGMQRLMSAAALLLVLKSNQHFNFQMCFWLKNYFIQVHSAAWTIGIK